LNNNLEKKIYISLFEGYLEANENLEKDIILELETLIQNICNINFHVNIDENYIYLHGWYDNILNFNFKERLLKAIYNIKYILKINIKYGIITITECKEEYKQYKMTISYT